MPLLDAVALIDSRHAHVCHDAPCRDRALWLGRSRALTQAVLGA